MNEKYLIKEIKIGNKDALDKVVNLYYHRVYGFVFRNTGNADLSKDLTQEIFIKIVCNITKYHFIGKFESWIFTIANNHLKNYWKLKKGYVIDYDMDSLFKNNTDGIKNIEEKDNMKNAVLQLPINQKTAIILKYYHDKKIKDIAKIMSTSVATTKSRIKYGLNKLKIILNEKED